MASYKTISAPFKFSGSLNNFERDVIEKVKMADKKSYGAYPDLFTVICSDLVPDPSDPSKTIPGPDHGKVFVIDKTRDLDPVYGYCVPVGGGDLPDNVTEACEEMPDPEERDENVIVQYVGPTTDYFDNGNFYKDTRVEGEIPQLYPLSGNYVYNFGGEDKELHIISTSANPEVGDKIYSLTFDADNNAQLTEVGTIKSTDPAVTLEGLGGDPDTEAEAISNLIDSFDASTPEKTPEVSDEPRPYDPGDVTYITGEQMVAAGSSLYYKVSGVTASKTEAPTAIQYEWPAGSGTMKTIDLVLAPFITKYGLNLGHLAFTGQKLVTITYDADNTPIFTEMAEIISGEAAVRGADGEEAFVGVKYTGPVAAPDSEEEAIKNAIDAIDGTSAMLYIDQGSKYLDWTDPSKAPSFECPSEDVPAFEIGDGSPLEFSYNSEEYSVKMVALGTSQPKFGRLNETYDHEADPIGLIVTNKTTGVKTRYNFGMLANPSAADDPIFMFFADEVPADFDTPDKAYLNVEDSSLPFKDELLAAWNAKYPEVDGHHFAEINLTKYDPTPAETPYKFPDYFEWTHVEQGKPASVTQNTFPINMDNFTGVTEFNEFSFVDFMTKATYKYNDTMQYIPWDELTSQLKDVIVLGSRNSIPGKTADEYFVATDYGDPISVGFRAINNANAASAKIVKVMASENGSTPTEVPITTLPNDIIYAVMSVLPPSASTTNTVNFVIYLEDGNTMTYNVKLTNKVSNAVWYGYIPVDPAGTVTLDNIPYETVDKALNETKTLKSKVVVINDSPRVDTPIDNNIDVKVTCSGSDNGHIAFFIPSLPADHAKDLINIPAIIDKNRLDNTDSFITYNVKDASGNFRGYLAVSKETPTCTNFKYSLTVNKFVVV